MKKQQEIQKTIAVEQSKEEQKPKVVQNAVKEQSKPQPPSQEKATDKPQQTLKSTLKQQLLAMQFEQQLIDQALLSSTTIEQAIETMVRLLQTQEQLQMNTQDQVQLILLVRMDLKMGMGKIAAQCGHATLRAFQNGRNFTQQYPQYAITFIDWLERGHKQVIYQVRDEEQLFAVLAECKQRGAATTYIRDAGRTQVAAGSSTVGAIGPTSSASLRAITSKLRLL